jgi:hypothetical protein
LSDTFAGIDAANAPAFVVAQLVGALVASGFFGWLLDVAPRCDLNPPAPPAAPDPNCCPGTDSRTARSPSAN